MSEQTPDTNHTSTPSPATPATPQPGHVPGSSPRTDVHQEHAPATPTTLHPTQAPGTPATPNPVHATSPRPLTRQQTYGVWGGVAGSAIGATAWLIAMAGLSSDWLAVGLTLALDCVVVFLFGRLCLRHPRSRFLFLGLLLVILTAHCLAIFWWRLDYWRADLNLDQAQLFSQKKVVTFAVSAMVAIVLVQMLLMHWLQNKARRIS